jgi:hypothetical protein
MTESQKAFMNDLANLHQYMPDNDGKMIQNITAMSRELSAQYCQGCNAACCRRNNGEECYFLTPKNTCRIYEQRPLACRLYFCPDVPYDTLQAMKVKYHLEMFANIDEVIPEGERWNPKEPGITATIIPPKEPNANVVIGKEVAVKIENKIFAVKEIAEKLARENEEE